MKKLSKTWMWVLVMLPLLSCSQNATTQDKQEQAPEQETSLGMNADSLQARIDAEMAGQVASQKAEIAIEALSVIGETRNLLRLLAADKKQEAIDEGHTLIGKFEVLLTKEPSLALLPVDVAFHQEETITDISTLRTLIKDAEKAMNDGYYQVARNILADLKSEMVIESYFIPTATYPEAIKVAVALLEDDKPEEARAVLQQVLLSIMIERTVVPLPVLKAEQMIIEAAGIDAENHDNAEQVLTLLRNAHYQLQLAEEMGYGKKDKEYKELYTAIKDLQKSVEKQQDSQPAFDALKEKIKAFRNRLFPYNKQKE
ncbi:MAG TPA: YfdX family protein [Flammeovirgaceae bacterium]|nr:YfdX family protein [Flammeovirgaceae bacterium]